MRLSAMTYHIHGDALPSRGRMRHAAGQRKYCSRGAAEWTGDRRRPPKVRTRVLHGTSRSGRSPPTRATASTGRSASAFGHCMWSICSQSGSAPCHHTSASAAGTSQTGRNPSKRAPKPTTASTQSSKKIFRPSSFSSFTAKLQKIEHTSAPYKRDF